MDQVKFVEDSQKFERIWLISEQSLKWADQITSYHPSVNLMHETPLYYKSEFLVQKLEKPLLRALILGEESLEK